MPKITTNIKVPSLAGGINIHENKFLIRDNQPVFLKNVDTSILGSWTKRNGYTQEGNVLEAGKVVDGLHSQVLNNGTKRLLGYVNGSLKYNNSGTWDNIATGKEAGARVEMTNWLNQVFVTGYDFDTGNYLDTFEISNLTDGSVNLTDAPNAKFSIEYNDRLYLANVEIDGTQYPSYMAYSSNPLLNGTITWDPTITGMIGVGISDGDEITGLAKGYGQMLIYKNRGVYIFNGNSLYRISNYGTTSHRSIKNVGQNVLAFHNDTDRKCITLYDGQGVTVISNNIEPFLENVTESKVVAGVKNGHYYLFLGDVTINEKYTEYHKIPSTITNCMIDLDFAHSNMREPIFSIYSLPIDVESMTEHDSKLYFGSDNGEVYEFATGNSDDGTPIEGIVQTKHYYGDQYNMFKVFQGLTINMHQSVTAKAYVSIDDSDWEEIGDCSDLVNVFDLTNKSVLPIDPFGYGLRVKVQANGDDGQFIMEGVEINYIPYKIGS